jgi:predicted anti-sigma-YlaC factor YlaD
MARQADHNRAEDLISAYLDQQVTAEEQQFFERHLAACAECRVQLETTRSMVAALRAMPVVKAPRSFVLPREMAKQPKRSILAWYPALRLATALAAIAFVVLFAGDLLISRSGSGGAALSIPAAAPAPQLEQAAESRQAAPTEAPATSNDSSLASSTPASGDTAATEVGVAAAPPAAGAAAKAVPTETITLTDSAAMTLSMPTATPEMTVVAAAQPALEATPEPAADASSERSAASAVEQPVTAVAPATPTLDPLRVIELALLSLVVVLGAAMFIARRKQV